jgi:hypothetical protein
VVTSAEAYFAQHLKRLSRLFRLAEQVGQFQDDDTRDITRIERVIVSWKPPGAETEGDV